MLPVHLAELQVISEKKKALMLEKKSFTLVEILVVVIIVGILVSLVLPHINPITEMSLDREAKAALALIRMAEKNCKMEEGSYYPNPINTVSDASAINTNLKLNLPRISSDGTDKRRWSYSVNSAAGLATATRVGVNADARQWTINFSGDGEVCAGGSACPS